MLVRGRADQLRPRHASTMSTADHQRAPAISSVRVTGEASALASRKISDASLTEQLGLNVGSGRFR
jgi:hypothetical protein